ncbi:HIT domain-containing protein [Sorangium sp. So ce136]|uniref:HIT domain-containing protein n=1 Tax=Sorangium sp. So ce136 TaxID=3133284 RepID=UPI003F075B79
MTSPFLEAPGSAWVASNSLAFALRDRFPVSPGHTLVIPRRLVSTWFDATAEERAAIFELVDAVKRQLDQELRPDGYNIGINAGEAAGQTVMHLHVHVIPRFRGDVDDPRGGVRHVIPGKGNYLAGRPSPLATGGADDPFLRHIAPIFARATDVAILAAFVQESGLDVLEGHVFAALARGARVRLVTGDYLHITQATALAELALDVAAWAEHQGRSPRVLVLAHREELLLQAAKTLRRLPQGRAARFSWCAGSAGELDGDMAFASVQKLSRPEQLARLVPGSFDYAIVDEVHHGTAPIYRAILDRHARARRRRGCGRAVRRSRRLPGRPRYRHRAEAARPVRVLRPSGRDRLPIGHLQEPPVRSGGAGEGDRHRFLGRVRAARLPPGCTASNRQRVSEVYAFDARGTPSNAGAAIQWFNARSDTVLRMTGGYQLAANDGIRISIEKLAGGPVSRVTATPPDAKAYQAGSNPLWDHVSSAYPQLRESADCWHQFAVFGGYVAVPGPFALTFLQQFLQDSLY